MHSHSTSGIGDGAHVGLEAGYHGKGTTINHLGGGRGANRKKNSFGPNPDSELVWGPCGISMGKPPLPIHSPLWDSNGI